MFIIIPGWFITLITMPGVIVHEIAHRFFCDYYSIPVYEINYFNCFSKDEAGYVIHAKYERFRHAFFVSIAPLIINSIFSIFLLSSCFYPLFFGLEFVNRDLTGLWRFMDLIVTWCALTIGFCAVPSNQDVNGLIELAHTRKNRFIARGVVYFVWLCNIELIGFFFRLFYLLILAFISGALVIYLNALFL